MYRKRVDSLPLFCGVMRGKERGKSDKRSAMDKNIFHASVADVHLSGRRVLKRSNDDMFEDFKGGTGNESATLCS